MNFNIIIGIVAVITWAGMFGYVIGRKSGYDHGSNTLKSLYLPDLQKNIESTRQLREAAISYGYAEWIITNNKNGETDFRWKPNTKLE